MPEQHPDIAPLAFLLGRWRGSGVVGYPTIETVRFGQQLSFSHNGKPFLIYSSRTWLLDEQNQPGRPLAMEVGFWRPQPENRLEVLLTHPTGISELYLGEITGTKIEMATDAVLRSATAKVVTAGKRLYGLIGTDLGYAYDMAAVGQPLQPHVSAQLSRVLADADLGAGTRGREQGQALKNGKEIPRAAPAREPPRERARVAGADWTRAGHPGVRCLP